MLSWLPFGRVTKEQQRVNFVIDYFEFVQESYQSLVWVWFFFPQFHVCFIISLEMNVSIS